MVLLLILFLSILVFILFKLIGLRIISFFFFLFVLFLLSAQCHAKSDLLSVVFQLHFILRSSQSQDLVFFFIDNKVLLSHLQIFLRNPHPSFFPLLSMLNSDFNFFILSHYEEACNMGLQCDHFDLNMSVCLSHAGVSNVLCRDICVILVFGTFFTIKSVFFPSFFLTFHSDISHTFTSVLSVMNFLVMNFPNDNHTVIYTLPQVFINDFCMLLQTGSDSQIIDFILQNSSPIVKFLSQKNVMNAEQYNQIIDAFLNLSQRELDLSKSFVSYLGNCAVNEPIRLSIARFIVYTKFQNVF